MEKVYILLVVVVSWCIRLLKILSTQLQIFTLFVILYCNLNFLNKLQYIKDKMVKRNEFVKNKCQINQLDVQRNKISLEPHFTLCVKINFQLAQSQVQKIQSKNRFFFFKLSMWDSFIWVTDILLEYVRLTNTNSFMQKLPSFSTENPMSGNAFSLDFKTENPRQSSPLVHHNVSVSCIWPYVRLYASVALKF